MASTRTESVGFLLTDVSRLMRRRFMQKLEAEQGGLTLAQARVLLHVSRNQGVRQIDVAELLEMQPITLARLIDALEADRLVERRPDPNDRRAYQIHLGVAAAEKLALIERVARAVRSEALRCLDAEQSAALMNALETMRGNLSAR
ncbi:MarR family winged helix-turn-helix transcriptional regulator [Uliginosibacterium sp. H1]|uniref:MarR family winged helix-turn-helix transcriptional regulator n=1 Tax=Uliginosibacterium sp. H1 TaxID=3114757 RepID=UPI002E16F89F|nr:MarR family transcriptional regulator [Uliginosibacterium sp. H1]